MSEQHTPTPWTVEEVDYYDTHTHDIIGSDDVSIIDGSNGLITEANARRIVACVNACEGIPTDYLESPDNEATQIAKRGYAEIIALRQQRDQLLAALKCVTEDILMLICESHGVAGLHLNGDVAPWGELEAGGRLERLMSLPDACKLIAAVEGKE